MQDCANSFDPATDKLDISVCRSYDEIAALVPEWLSLLAKKHEYAFYHHPAWALALKQTLVADSFCCVVIRIEGEMQAVLSFCSNARDSKKIGSPEHDHISLSDWVLSVPSVAKLIIENISGIVDAVARVGYTKLTLKSVPQTSCVVSGLTSNSAIERGSEAGGPWLFRTVTAKQSYWFDCSGAAESVEDYRGLPLSSKLKRNLRGRRKKLADRHNLQFIEVSGKEERLEALNEFFRLETLGWKGQQGQNTAIAGHQNLMEFYQALMQAEMPGWQPAINLLKADGQPIAAQFQVASSSCISLLKIAFDESWSDYSPGSLILEDCLLASFNKKEAKQLSLVTCPGWADRWHPHKTDVLNLSFYRNTVRGKVQVAFDDTKQQLKKIKS